MGQYSSKIFGPRSPKSLGTSLGPLITSFVQDVDYIPPSEADYHVLQEAVEKRALLSGVPFLPGDDEHSYKCLRTGLIITHASSFPVPPF